MKRKGLLIAVFLVAAMMLLQTPGLASNLTLDLDYSGPINSFTGAPTGGVGTTQNQNRVPVSAGIYYDRSERAYIYDLASVYGETISASVADGMIVNEPVRITPSKGLNVRLYQDGDLVENPNLSLIESTGRYVLEAQTQGGQYVRVMSFTVVGATTCLINSYPMPSGFVITDVDFSVKDEEGNWVESQAKWDRSKVSMSEDGKYRVKYECARNGMSYTLQTVIDHTPPKLALENVINGLARGPVDISDLEEGCKIGIALNGGSMSYRRELTLSGDYRILLQDEAGNLTDYEFTILVYFDANSWIFFGLVLLVIAGVGAYLYIERKRMRIR